MLSCSQGAGSRLLRSTEEAFQLVDFGDLEGSAGGCIIEDTAMRAIQLTQLEQVSLHLI